MTYQGLRALVWSCLGSQWGIVDADPQDVVFKGASRHFTVVRPNLKPVEPVLRKACVRVMA